MPVDYDLVIIGGSSTARYAAAIATQWQARVALVEPHPPDSSAITIQALIEAGKQAVQRHRVRPSSLWAGSGGGVDQPTERQTERQTEPSASPGPAPAPDRWTDSLVHGQQVAERWADGAPDQSLEGLMAAGVDVILGAGRFRHQRRLLVTANERHLTAIAYLLAPPVQPVIPAIEGLASIPYLTPQTLVQQTTLPHRLLILGGDPAGLELAQALNRLGVQVTLILPSPLLPQEDPQAIAWLQAQLEAEGVTILPETIVTQTKVLGSEIWVQAKHQALAADALLITMGQQALFDGLELEAVGVRIAEASGATRLWTNRLLQTTNPHIYACGEAVGGYSRPSLNYYEAELAVKNALFFPNRSANYAPVPWVIGTDPELARVGLTEFQARQRYGDDVLVLHDHFHTSVHALVMGQTTGFCKLIVRRNGDLLGAHIVATQAREWIGIVAIALQHNLTVQAFAEVPFASPSFAEILQRLARQWQYQRRLGQRRWREAWFEWRRSRH